MSGSDKILSQKYSTSISAYNYLSTNRGRPTLVVYIVQTVYVLHHCKQARSQDLEKGGGYFERVRSVQTTLTGIFIDLEAVSDGLSEN